MNRRRFLELFGLSTAGLALAPKKFYFDYGANLYRTPCLIAITPTSGTFGGIDRSPASAAWWRNREFHVEMLDSQGIKFTDTIRLIGPDDGHLWKGIYDY